MQHCETLTVTPLGATTARFCEFDVGVDGKVLADALVEKYGTKEAAIEEMLYMTVIAAQRNDLTTINGLACARAYWRREVNHGK